MSKDTEKSQRHMPSFTFSATNPCERSEANAYNAFRPEPSIWKTSPSPTSNNLPAASSRPPPDDFSDNLKRGSGSLVPSSESEPRSSQWSKSVLRNPSSLQKSLPPLQQQGQQNYTFRRDTNGPQSAVESRPTLPYSVANGPLSAGSNESFRWNRSISDAASKRQSPVHGSLPPQTVPTPRFDETRESRTSEGSWCMAQSPISPTDAPESPPPWNGYERNQNGQRTERATRPSPFGQSLSRSTHAPRSWQPEQNSPYPDAPFAPQGTSAPGVAQDRRNIPIQVSDLVFRQRRLELLRSMANQDPENPTVRELETSDGLQTAINSHRHSPGDFVPAFGRMDIQSRGTQRSNRSVEHVSDALTNVRRPHVAELQFGSTHLQSRPAVNTLQYPRGPQSQQNTDLAMFQYLQDFNNCAPGNDILMFDHPRMPRFPNDHHPSLDSPHMQQLIANGQLRTAYDNQFHFPFGQNVSLGPFSSSFGLNPVVNFHNLLPRGLPEPDSTHDVRSALLEDYKNSSRNTRRWELKDIYNHVVEFSGDHQGSLFIQDHLRKANSEEKELVFRELLPNAMQLMTDVFGNYVIQVYFDQGDQVQKRILAQKMKGHVLTLSMHVYGCRVVQRALERVLVEQQAELIKELRNNVIKCVKDQNGNHVIQKAITEIPQHHIQFIIDAFQGEVFSMATHVYGCRVVQRLHERCEGKSRHMILRELHANAAKLVSDSYGNYVIQHILESGAPADKERLTIIVRENLINYSKQKFASNVVEKCIEHCSEDDRVDIMRRLSEKDERGDSHLQFLIKDGYGNYVVQKMLDRLTGDHLIKFCDLVSSEVAKARRIAVNKQVENVAKKLESRREMSGILTLPRHSTISLSGFLNPAENYNDPAVPQLVNDADQSPTTSSVPSTSDGNVPSQTSSGITLKEATAPQFHENRNQHVVE